jgi:hypothetical protein
MKGMKGQRISPRCSNMCTIPSPILPWMAVAEEVIGDEETYNAHHMVGMCQCR